MYANFFAYRLFPVPECPARIANGFARSAASSRSSSSSSFESGANDSAFRAPAYIAGFPSFTCFLIATSCTASWFSLSHHKNSFTVR